MTRPAVDLVPKRLLLHVCCGPCALGALPFWKAQDVEVVGFFFNPNVHPLLEFRRRLTSAREAATHTEVRLEVDEYYDPEAWFAATAGSQGSRCDRCISMRLERSAREAAARECEAFSTSLSLSPWQDHKVIETRGQEAGRKHGVRFIYQDLRSRYGDSRRESRLLGLYRQKYCGCLVSECERYTMRVRAADGMTSL